MSNYSELRRVYEDAIAHAESGKGRERHSNGKPFEQQRGVQIAEQIGSNHGPIFQAMKKASESVRLTREHARAELLGAINYLAMAVVVLDREMDHLNDVQPRTLRGVEDKADAAGKLVPRYRGRK